jgi:hypothetical protein
MTMAIDDEIFFAWLDGELSAEDADRVAAAVADDPELARRAEQHRAFETRFRGAYDSVAAAPLPERLAHAIKPSSARAVQFSAPRRAANDGWAWPQWAAIAATLVLGIGLGTTLNSERSSSPVELRGGQMLAAAQLAETLDAELASGAAANGVRVGLTFRDQSGTICRTFVEQRSTGLACREGDRWRLRGLFAAPEGQSGDYRMAAGTDPNLAALIDSTIEGEPLDAVQEKDAKARGWR